MRRNGVSLVVLVFLTVFVETGFYVLGKYGGDGTGGLMCALGAAVLWSAFLPASIAAGPGSIWDGLLRGGCVADAALVSFVVVWLFAAGGGGDSFWWVLKVYCVIAAVVLAGCAAAVVPRSRTGRCLAPIVTAVFFFIVLSSPLWGNTWLQDTAGGGLAGWLLRVNPFFAVCDCVVELTAFNWTEAGWMYNHTAIGENVAAGEVGWYETALLYLAAAAVLGGVACLCRLAAFRGNQPVLES